VFLIQAVAIMDWLQLQNSEFMPGHLCSGKMQHTQLTAGCKGLVQENCSMCWDMVVLGWWLDL